MRLFVSLVAVQAAATEDPVTSSKRYNAGGGIARVTKLLNDLKAQIKSDVERDTRMHDKFACFCQEEGKARAERIEKSKQAIRDMGEAIQMHTSKELAAQEEQKRQQAAMNKATKNMARIKAEQKKMMEDWAVRSSELQETIDTLKAALGALGAGKDGFLQTAVSEKDLALLSTLTGKSVNAANMGQATGYLSQMLKNTQEDMEQEQKEVNEKTELRAKQTKAQQEAFNIAEKIFAEQKKVEATNSFKKAASERKYKAADSMMTEDVAFYESLVPDCEKRHKFFNELKERSEAEVSAIGKAVAALAKASGSFLQTSVRKMMKRTTLADGLKKKIKQMIADLEKEITEIQAAKAKCINDLQTARVNLQEGNDQEAKQQASHDNAKMLKKRAKAAEAKAADEKAATEAAMKAAEEDFSAVDTSLTSDVKNAKTDSAALKEGIEILAKVFGIDVMEALGHTKHTAKYNNEQGKMAGKGGKKGQETDFSDAKKRAGAGEAILKMLNSMKKQTDNSIREMEEELKETEAAHKKQMKDLKKSKEASALAETEAKEEASTFAGNQKGHADDLKVTQGKVEGFEKAVEDSKCKNKDNDWNKRIAARRHDISGYNQVVTALDSAVFKEAES